MIRLLIADDEVLEREALADIVARRFEHEITIETAENGRKAADTAVLAAENGECTLQMTLRQNAVVRFTLSTRNQQGDYGYDCTWYQQHS